MVHMRVPSQRDKRVDVQQRHREGSILVQCSLHHLGRDWRRTCRHTDDWQSVVSLNPSGGQPSTSQLRDNGAERSALSHGELPRNRNYILVDIQGRPHEDDASASTHQRSLLCWSTGEHHSTAR
jgi:hypothetical protein